MRMLDRVHACDGVADLMGVQETSRTSPYTMPKICKKESRQEFVYLSRMCTDSLRRMMLRIPDGHIRFTRRQGQCQVV